MILNKPTHVHTHSVTCTQLGTTAIPQGYLKLSTKKIMEKMSKASECAGNGGFGDWSGPVGTDM